VVGFDVDADLFFQPMLLQKAKMELSSQLSYVIL
jgi:hypothetical protein